jgi:citrate lyase subunit beta / citryl-CoA lyase
MVAFEPPSGERPEDQLQQSLDESAATARTWLFVPGDRAERFDKAIASGADEVICDLEDAVAPTRKDRARVAVARWLTDGGSGWVRINGVGTEWHRSDVQALIGVPGLRGLVVPKAENPAELGNLARELGDRGLVALVETVVGIHYAYELAKCDGVGRLAFGSIDFANDLGAEETRASLLLARATLVLASRVAGIPAPIDGVTTTLDDAKIVAEAADYARQLGFGGKLCIHPAQISPIASAFRPSVAQIRWAREILRVARYADGGATAVDGRMIDKPILDRARSILALVEDASPVADS